MSKPHVYLAGRMTGLADRGADWRETATATLSPDFLIENPLLLELATKSPAHIVRADTAAIARSTAVLAYVGDSSWGTAMELWIALQLKVPVLGFYRPEQRGMKISPWLEYTVHSWHLGLDDACYALRRHYL